MPSFARIVRFFALIQRESLIDTRKNGRFGKPLLSEVLFARRFIEDPKGQASLRQRVLAADTSAMLQRRRYRI